MHGGTAINLFMQKAPRLSVDADITYIGNESKDIADIERPVIENAIKEIGAYLCYNVTATKNAIAGRTFKLRYSGERGSDYIKIDINYLNQIPLLPLTYLECVLDNNVHITTLSREELIAGKAKALFDRVAMRDIYDISRLYHIIEEIFDLDNETVAIKLHRTILFYTALANLFPTDFIGLTKKRFSGNDRRVIDELYPMLNVADRPTLTGMIADAEAFVEQYVAPQNKDEIEYPQFPPPMRRGIRSLRECIHQR